MVMNPLQEQALWAGIVKERQGEAASFPGPLHRLAAMAMEAHRLICLYAPQVSGCEGAARMAAGCGRIQRLAGRVR